jgi:hypothetical protein
MGFSMISMIWAMAKRCCIIVAAVPLLLPAAPCYAEPTYYVSNGGTSSCGFDAPCPSLSAAVATMRGQPPGEITRIRCQNITQADGDLISFDAAYSSIANLDIDCAGGYLGGLAFSNRNTTVRIRGLNFFGSTINDTPSNKNGLRFTGSGALILENCDFRNYSLESLIVSPVGRLNLVIKNSRISNSGSGILMNPSLGGSVHATLDNVIIASNNGGGIKIDSTSGPVTLDVTGSVISGNAGNGINAVAKFSQSMISIKDSVIARNGVAGVQANGTHAGILMSTTLLDQNGSATSIAGGGSILSYGNNDIVGPIGSGFSATTPLQ